MNSENPRQNQIPRIILISACLLMFAGFIAFSLSSVGYLIDDENTNELEVTRLSLTHSIERNDDGSFDRADEEGLACPT